MENVNRGLGREESIPTQEVAGNVEGVGEGLQPTGVGNPSAVSSVGPVVEGGAGDGYTEDTGHGDVQGRDAGTAPASARVERNPNTETTAAILIFVP